jgi:hypothetical protein
MLHGPQLSVRERQLPRLNPSIPDNHPSQGSPYAFRHFAGIVVRYELHAPAPMLAEWFGLVFSRNHLLSFCASLITSRST